MAEKERTSGTSVTCTPTTKTKYNEAAARLNVTLPEIADLAIEALLPLIQDEETTEQRRARLLAKSNPTPSRVRPDSKPTPSVVGVVS
jgi:hypothetical protein